jgi:glycine cleavage system H protein
MDIPKNLKYTNNHEWLKVEGDTALVGITGYAQGELGDIVYVEIEVEGETLDKGESFGTIEAVKTVSDLYMPVSGEVLEVNPVLEEKPETINNDPHGEGWMIRIKITDEAQVNELMDNKAYEELINS